jgi:hypothetical protein
MRIIEMAINEEEWEEGISAISIVENPAIESNFVALSDEKVEVKLAEVDKDKQILIGPALIPNKPIYRKDENGEPYYIYFSGETVAKASELYLARGKQNNATVEHNFEVDGVSVIESWIVEDPEKDKAATYGLSVPKGTWMVTMKIYDEELWQDYVKTGDVKGFSIEGMFGAVKMKEELTEEAVLSAYNDVYLESYSDYPEAAKNAAKRALDWAEENGWGDCGTSVGKARANQLAKGEAISRDTIARMAAFARHKQNSETPYGEGCGKLMWDAWGGTAGIEWAANKLKQLDK